MGRRTRSPSADYSHETHSQTRTLARVYECCRSRSGISFRRGACRISFGPRDRDREHTAALPLRPGLAWLARLVDKSSVVMYI